MLKVLVVKDNWFLESWVDISSCIPRTVNLLVLHEYSRAIERRVCNTSFMVSDRKSISADGGATIRRIVNIQFHGTGWESNGT